MKTTITVENRILKKLKAIKEKTKKLNEKKEPPIKITNQVVLNEALEKIKEGIKFD